MTAALPREVPVAASTLVRVAELAAKTAQAPWDDEVLRAVRRCVVDWLGVAVAGWDEPVSRKLRSLLMREPREVSTLTDAFAEDVAPDHAALSLATASHALDYDDTDYVNLIHVSSTLFPALFALAIRERLSGDALLRAFGAAYEAEDRIGAALGRKLTARGWHVSGVIGHLGAALGAGLALKLPVDRLAHAMAIAGTASSGMIAAFGTMSKPLQLARGAADGVTAARLARDGFTGPVGALDADPGFTFPLLGEAIGDWTPFLRDWGRPYAVLRNAFKPHASCMITHPIVDAAVALREALRTDGIAPERIARVVCRVSSLAPKVAGHARPSTGLEGKFSVAYCCVAGLVLGRATPDAFAADVVARADVRALLDRVNVVPDAAIGEQQAVVSLRTDDDRSFTRRVDMAKGNPANPMSDAELDAKFLSLAAPSLGSRAEEVLQRLHRFESLDDVGAWLASLRPPGR